jgi:hypothetical protein
MDGSNCTRYHSILVGQVGNLQGRLSIGLPPAAHSALVSNLLIEGPLDNNSYRFVARFRRSAIFLILLALLMRFSSVTNTRMVSHQLGPVNCTPVIFHKHP